MNKHSLIWPVIPIVFGVPVTLFAIFSYCERAFGKLPVLGNEITVNGKKTDHRIPAFTLINQEGKTANIQEWNDKIVVVDFFFTHCPVICPKMTKSLKKVQNAFNQEEVRITSISIDPERDHPERLQWYAAKFGIETANWQLLTGNKKEIYKLARNGFRIVATDGDGGPDDFIHSEKLVLLDGQQRIRGYYDGTSEKEVSMLIQDIKKLRHEN